MPDVWINIETHTKVNLIFDTRIFFTEDKIRPNHFAVVIHCLHGKANSEKVKFEEFGRIKGQMATRLEMRTSIALPSDGFISQLSKVLRGHIVLQRYSILYW